jgi:hypothetical protein
MLSTQQVREVPGMKSAMIFAAAMLLALGSGALAQDADIE